MHLVVAFRNAVVAFINAVVAFIRANVEKRIQLTAVTTMDGFFFRGTIIATHHTSLYS